MSIYKDNVTGKWRVVYRYTDWTGETHQHPKEDERIFTISKSYLHHEMNRGSKISGVKRIRVYDLRHPYVKPKTKNIILKSRKPKLPRLWI